MLRKGKLHKPCIKCNESFIPNGIKSKLCEKCLEKSMEIRKNRIIQVSKHKTESGLKSSFLPPLRQRKPLIEKDKTY
jgi:hypothetical protein